MTLTPDQADLVGGGIGLFFTVALLSYLIDDNVVYRLALHLFVGVSAGYAALIVIYQVLTPRLVAPITSGNTTASALAVAPLILFLFLIMKLNPRTAPLGNLSIGYMIGTGTAVAVGGAITGTLLPQVMSMWKPGSAFPNPIVNQAIIVVGAVTTLLYFQYWLRGETPAGAERAVVMRVLTDTGQGFVVAALGAIYAGMILSGLAVLSERVVTLSDWISGLLR